MLGTAGGKDPMLPVGLEATKDGIQLAFTGALDQEAAANAGAYNIEVWDLKRTKSYGSKHYNQRKLQVEKAVVANDGKSVRLHIPDLKPTWGMAIKYKLRDAAGEEVVGEIHNSIHQMPKG